ncbi:hypothetical protein [Frigoriglobus tundricola]|uniref:Uncharacterized protein n=1 Tax=Frigoriglobus tundricola TaxID=2774151 RepID=A0A6M5YMF3_9BACT|nr:hypothetical protein [Frigoriglobus tundricola]QJW94774.1 hypothetical protein FTUN_2297 [Frigoriglobus tundricola]
MTLLVALFTIPVALGVGIGIGRRRGLKVGVASGFGVLVAGGVAFVALLALSLPM